MGRISLPLLGLTIALLPGCAHHDADPVPPNIADHINPDLRRRYVDAATVNGCYGPPPPKPSPIYQKAGATDEEFQRTKARCLLQRGIGANFNPLAFSLCMRAEGWVLVQK